MTKELAGKILGDLYDVQYEIVVAQQQCKKEIEKMGDDLDIQAPSFYLHLDLETAYEEVEKVIKRLEPYDK